MSTDHVCIDTLPFCTHCKTEYNSALLQERVTGSAYDSLVDELLTALRARYGPQVLIHWEDFGVGNAFRLLAKYQQQVGSYRPPFQGIMMCKGICNSTSPSLMARTMGMTWSASG